MGKSDKRLNNIIEDVVKSVSVNAETSTAFGIVHRGIAQTVGNRILKANPNIKIVVLFDVSNRVCMIKGAEDTPVGWILGNLGGSTVNNDVGFYPMVEENLEGHIGVLGEIIAYAMPAIVNMVKEGEKPTEIKKKMSIESLLPEGITLIEYGDEGYFDDEDEEEHTENTIE